MSVEPSHRRAPPARRGAESLPVLLGLLARAAAARAVARLPRRLLHAAITGGGLVALVTPLLLWVAWSREVLLGVLATGVGAMALVALLLALYPEDRY